MNESTQEQQPKPEVVELNQRFQLVRLENLVSTVRPHNSEKRGFSCPVSLELFSGYIPIPFDINFDSDYRIDPTWIIPLNSDMGYRITNEDFDPKSRYEKLQKAARQISELKDGFTLSLSSKGKLSKDYNALRELQQLRVHLFFSNGSYESQPAGDVSKEKTLTFSHFYPLDTGPLPQLPNKEHNIGEIRPFKGHRIALPNIFVDRGRLSQIQARFVFAPEEPGRGGEG